MAKRKPTNEKCAICSCSLHRRGGYAEPTREGRSHASSHHFVAERFFGRSKNRPKTLRARVFEQCPWGLEGRHDVFCYDCHEELLHNPVLCPDDLHLLAELVAKRGLNETEKPRDYAKIGGRIQLLHEVIAKGIRTLLKD